MKCIVTAGPTYEPLDKVRRLTNFSTGRLGIQLSNELAARGHHVTLLLGYYATYRGNQSAQVVRRFGTTGDLAGILESLASPEVHGVFHAAAVSDFAFGKVWERTADGRLNELNAAKLSTRKGGLMAELLPTRKLIGDLRQWFPRARLVGWKYELDGDREAVISKAQRQMAENRTDACVANGRAYGEGFGLVRPNGASQHLGERAALYAALVELLEQRAN
jgi:phosphopantothenate---cysteine ligase (CTP)